MKTSDRAILIGVALLGLAVGFYFLVLAPKREEAAGLQDQVGALESQVVEAEAAAAAGQEAKKGFKGNYRKLITLGKAVPVDADTPSLLTELQTLADQSQVGFQSITLSSAAAMGAATATAPTTAVPASEAAAALVPIGATVGTAGLPVMPYEMQFAGGFFEIADFFGAVDGMVDSHGERTSVHGRLLTIDGFNLTPGPAGLPALTANVTATSYLTPADQGLTAGATAAGPTTVTQTATEAVTTPPADPAAEPPATAVVSN